VLMIFIIIFQIV